MPKKPEEGNNYKEQPVDFKQDARDFSSRILEPRLRTQVSADLLGLAEKLIFLMGVDKKKQASLSSAKSEEQKTESKQMRNIKLLLNLFIEPAYIEAEAGLVKIEKGVENADSLKIQNNLKKMIEQISKNIGIGSANEADDSISLEFDKLGFKRNDEINENLDLLKVKLSAGDGGNNIEGEFADGKKIAIKPEKGLSKEEIELNNKAAFLFLHRFEKKIGKIRSLLKEKEEKERKEERIKKEFINRDKVNSLLKELESESVDYKKYSLSEIDGAKQELEKKFEEIKSTAGQMSLRTGGGVYGDYIKERNEILERKVV